jgi:hypothetical protein
MSMPKLWPTLSLKRLWLYALSLLGGLAGWVLGYDFGRAIAGPEGDLWIAWLVAFNCAIFCTLIVAALLDRIAAMISGPADGA